MVKFWISLLIGLFCIFAWLGMRDEGSANMKWPSVPGVITDMNVSVSHSSDGTINRTASVKYSYSVDGKSYQGDRANVSGSPNAATAESLYPKGKQVPVFYNPAKPSDAVLEQGSGGSWIWGFGGLCCLAYAGYVLVERRKQKKTPATASESTGQRLPGTPVKG